MNRNSDNVSPIRPVTGPRSLTRLLSLFPALAAVPDGLTLAQLNATLKSPKSSLLNLLRPLVADGYLVCDNGRYRLGASIFRLAANIMAVWNFSGTLRPHLETLAQLSQESVYVGILEPAHRTIVYVDAIESPHSVRFSVPIGAERPLYNTAAGRVLLAYADPAWLDQYLKTTKLQAVTKNTISTRTDLLAELSKVRDTRVSVSLGELFAESAAIASPVFGANGKVMAAIAIGAPVVRLLPRLDELRPIISQIAARASGGTRTDLPAFGSRAAFAAQPGVSTVQPRRLDKK